MSLQPTKICKEFFKWFHKRAAFGFALFLFLTTKPLLSSPKCDFSPFLKWEDKVQELILAEEREATLNFLKSKKDIHGGRCLEKWINKWTQKTVQLFFTQETQKLFEQGRSLYSKDAKSARQKFIQAYEREPFNEAALMGLVRSEIRLGQCPSARKRLEEWLEIQPYSRDGYELYLSVLGCMGQWLEAKKLVQKFHQYLSSENLYVLANQAFFEIEENNWDKALVLANNIINKDTGYPLGYYLRARVLEKQDNPHQSEDEKYDSICKKLHPRVVSKYKNDPQLCRRN